MPSHCSQRLCTVILCSFTPAFLCLCGLRPVVGQAPPSTLSSTLDHVIADADAGKFDQALTLLNAQLAATTDPKDQNTLRTAIAEIDTLSGINSLQNSKYQAALAAFQQAYAMDTQLQSAGISRDLTYLGVVYKHLGQNDKALDYDLKALAIAQTNTDKTDLGEDLSNIGAIYEELGQYDKALDYDTHAFDAAKASGDKRDQEEKLGNVGIVYEELGQYDKAQACDQQALTAAVALGDKEDAEKYLGNIGIVCDKLGQYDKALHYDHQAFAMAKANKDKSGEDADLGSMGNVYQNLGQYDKALVCDQQILADAKVTGDRLDQEMAQSNIATIYFQQGRYTTALDDYQKALAEAKEIGNKPDQEKDLGNIGNIYEGLGQYDKALDFSQQALSAATAAGNKPDIESFLANIGIVYDDLGQEEKALDYDQQALTGAQEIGDKAGEEKDLGTMGVACEELGQRDKALSYYQQAYDIQKSIGDRQGEEEVEYDIGTIYEDLGQHDKALDYDRQALANARAIGNKEDEEHALGCIGYVDDDLGQHDEALACYQQAVVIGRAIGNTEAEGTGLHDLMVIEQKLSRPRVAIFYGKQAINIYQSIRAGIAHIDKQSQKSYLTSHADTYRTLADLLIGEGRLPEAQQVLRLLKQQEFYDFLNEKNDLDNPSTPMAPPDTLPSTPHETHWLKIYNTDLPQMTAVDKVIDETQAKILQVQQEMTADFQKPSTNADFLSYTTQADDLARALPTGSAAIYTIVAPDRLYLIVVTPGKQAQARYSQITAAELYQKVYEFRQVLMDPKLDPRPLASDLYDSIIAPIQTDLDKAHATTLLFSLDDALRYIPPAALYNPDTKHYLVQDYNTSLITLTDASPPSPTAAAVTLLGAGVSESQDGMAPLPGVKLEMEAIVHEPGDPGGLIPGHRIMDDRFTKTSLEGDLKSEKYQIVHIASHFALHPSDTDSYLLLGDGSHLTVAELKRDPRRFQGVSLLTLSACDTAMEVKSSTGREVEGFGTLAQNLGAHSVLASLWPVSDAVTPQWMEAFYGYQKSHPKASLAQAARQAQLSLLEMSAPDTNEPDSTAKRGSVPVNTAPFAEALPFPFDPKTPYAHPFYWAPFILIGNWR